MSLNVFYHTILDYSMAFGNTIDENIKTSCYLLMTTETRIRNYYIMALQH